MKVQVALLWFLQKLSVKQGFIHPLYDGCIWMLASNIVLYNY